MRNEEIVEFQWPYFASLIGSTEEIERSAVESGALRRRREVRSGDVLLRLAMTYGFCGFSLRQTAAYAQTIGFASLSDVGVLKRLRRCDLWLGALLARKLSERAGAAPTHKGFRMRIVDATTVSRPGSKGTDLRLHMSMDLRRGQVDSVEITDAKGAENLTRFQFAPSDLVLADRGYANAKGIQSVVTAGASFIIRISRHSLTLQQRDSQPFDFLNKLNSLPEAAPGEFLVQVRSSTGPVIPCRLIAIRKSEPATERTRSKILAEGRKKGRQTDPRTLESAAFMVILTNLPEVDASMADVLELYRFRWQIEMNFKDLKTVIDLDSIPAKDPALARTLLFAKLLGAFLIDDFTTRYVSFSPWGYKLHSTRLDVETPSYAA